MTEHPQMETRVSLLELQLKTIERDAEKREKLQDSRHSETMAKLDALDRALSAGRDFNRGVGAVVKTVWAVIGGLVVSAAHWLIQKGGS